MLQNWNVVMVLGVGLLSAMTALLVVLSLATILIEYNVIKYYPAQKPWT
jgi:hypothetical protein